MMSGLFFIFLSDALNGQHDSLLCSLDCPIDYYGIRIEVLFVLGGFLASQKRLSETAAGTLLTAEVGAVQQFPLGLAERLAKRFALAVLNPNRKIPGSQPELLELSCFRPVEEICITMASTEVGGIAEVGSTEVLSWIEHVRLR